MRIILLIKLEICFNMISSRYNNETGMLETIFEGKVAISDLKDYIISVREDKTLPKRLKIFSDASNGKFARKVKPKELVQFLEENRITLTQKEFIYDAFVISGPMEMALGMLYKRLNKIGNYKFNIFSTKEAALSWLKEV